MASEAPSIAPGRSYRTLAAAACVVIVIAGLKLGASILAPFALALFLAFLSFPVVFWLQEKGWPSWLATLGTLALNFLIMGSLVFLAYVSVGDFDQALPVYREKSVALYQVSLEWLGRQPWFDASKVSLDVIQPASVFDITRKGLLSLVDVLSNAALVFVIMLFALLEAASFPGKLRYIFGQTEGDPERFHGIVREIVSYLWIKTVVSLATGLFVGLGAWMIGVDFPVLWGLLTFALNYIPTIGSILPAIPSVLLALVQLGWGSALAFLGVTVAANVIFGNVVEPMMMGRRLGLSTLVVTLSLVFWGWLWGPVGMLLSVPLTMVIKIIVGNIPDLKWIAVLLSDWNPEKQPEPMPEEKAAAETAPESGPAEPSAGEKKD
ncbi:MAG: AI-2E family transporter [Candidatus Methylacidiphilales bacterium]|nr:AI-2E family transporter [Candidatus Methylacidiphilales bacterium]